MESGVSRACRDTATVWGPSGAMSGGRARVGALSRPYHKPSGQAVWGGGVGWQWLLAGVDLSDSSWFPT